MQNGVQTVTPAQVRMARAAVNWSLDQLAQAAGVHRNTIHNFESGRYSGSPEKLRAVRQALQQAGVEFIGDAENAGVRLCKAANVGQLAIFHHDPDHNDDFMAQLEKTARKAWSGALVAREQMIITPCR